MKTTIFTLCFIACLAVALAKADPANAQGVAVVKAAALDGWLGCWRLEDDLAGTGARVVGTVVNEY